MQDEQDAHAPAPAPPAPAQARLPPVRTATRRRQSTNERIHDIIETGRQRAESVASDPLALQQTATHRTMDSSRVAPDETTGIFSQGPGQSYLALSKTTSSRRGTAAAAAAAKLKAQVGEEEDDDEQERDEALPPPPQQQSSVRKRRPKQGDEDEGGGANGHGHGHDDDEDTVNEERPSWLRRGVARFHSLELENKGSVARDHLALERTFLAWLRTSLAFASIGVAVTQLFRLDTSSSGGGTGGVDGNRLRQMGRPLGTAFLAISILTLLLGCRRYYRAQEWILRGKFPASRGTILVMAFIALALMVLALVVIVAIHPPG